MVQPKDYIALNKDSWNRRTEYHVKSEFYDMDNFLNGSSSLNPFELALLGDLNGKSVLHLQCHFGQDSISLSRMGANVVGVDLSDKAIDTAKQIALQTNSSAQFICCDIYDLPQHLDQQFDILFTSYGTIGWLPDLNKWAGIISKHLKPGGQFVFVEFHPVVWMFDNDFEKVGYNYFNTGALIETETGTYADREADLEQEYVCWNHSLSEVMGSLIQNDLTIRSFEEYDYSPYNCFRHTIEFEPKKYRIAHLDNKIPMVYSLVATK